MRINVLGWYRDNIGDESYKLAFPQMFPDASFVFSDSPIPEEFDLTILGGGDILSESFVKRLLSANSKKKVAISVSANANSPFDLLKQVDEIYVRDNLSLKLLKAHDVPCHFMPDIAFLLKANQEKGEKWLKDFYHDEQGELYEKKIGFVLNAHLFQGKPDILARDFLNFTKVSWDMARLMDETSASFVLFPMSTRQPYDDRATNSMVSSRCKFYKKNLVVYDRLNVQETLNLLSSLDLVISTRLHSSIFCLSSQIPFIDVTHHDKNGSFLESFCLQDHSLSYWNFEYLTLKEKVQHMLINSDDYKAKLRSKTDEIRNILNGEIKKFNSI